MFTKECPDCGEVMQIVRDPETREELWECSAYPKCEWREILPEDTKLRRMGAPRLFEAE